MKPQKRPINQPKKWRTYGKWLAGILLLPAFLGMVLFGVFNAIYPLDLPKINVSTTVVASHGEVLRQFSDDKGVFRHWTTLDAVSPAYLEALIAYEDRYFYQHPGVNPLSTLRALTQWIRHQSIISGSSTLTMQVARLLYPHERTISGKIEQMFRALQLELKLSKDEILTLYINLAPMGGNIEGVSSASERYFSKKASELTLAESALFVALPQRPSIYRPDRDLQSAREARDKVLTRLRDFSVIDERTYLEATKDPINYTPSETAHYAPLLAEKLKRENPDSHLIQTTIDYELQRTVEAFLLKESEKFAPRVSSAILIIHNQTHEIKTYIGSVDLFDRSRAGFIDMVTSIRSPGSTLKPFAYGLALDYGIVHEASLLTDVPRSFNGYEPQNFDRKFRGRVPMSRALQHSLNVPVVQVFQHLTPHFFLKSLRDAGIRLHVGTPTLSLILGGVGTSLEEQVRLFSSLGTNGQVYPLTVLMKDEDTSDQASSQSQNAGKALLSPEANWIITKILRGVNPPKRLNTRGIAWKTGTSYGYRDAWAIGTSPDWTVGVWIGRPDGVPNVGMLAGDISAPMLFDIFSLLPKDQHHFIKPEEVEQAEICWPSGRRKVDVPANECFQTFQIDTIAGNVPKTLYDAKGESPHEGWPKLLSDEALKPKTANDIQTHHLEAQGDENSQEADSIALQNAGNKIDQSLNIDQKHHSHGLNQSSSNNTSNSNNNSNGYSNLNSHIQGIKILTLANQSIIFKSDYNIPLKAQGIAPLRWYLDGSLLTEPILEMKTLKPGIHRLSVQDNAGNSDQVTFEVREVE